MKSWIVGLVITALSIGCQKDNIGPPELLYQRWKLGDNTYFLTFRPDGIILHGQDSQDTYCCSPRFFLLQGNRINLKDAPSKPLPAGIREANCGYVRCAGPGDSWQIVELTAQRLVLAQPWGQQVYKAD